VQINQEEKGNTVDTTKPLSEVAADLVHYVARKIPAKVSTDTSQGDRVSLEVNCQGQTWTILLSRAEDGSLVTNLVDPDGDVVKDLYDTPTDAADYLIEILGAASK
jgi:hypothetical protein